MIGIIIKGIDGILELISGVILFLIKSDLITKIIQTLFQHELVQDPTDIIANYLIHTSQNLTISALSFATIYLIIHGSVKIGLVLGLWYKKLWAYPLVGVILSLFIIYQLIKFFSTHSIILLFLTSIDVLIIILLRFEYKRLIYYQ